MNKLNKYLILADTGDGEHFEVNRAWSLKEVEALIETYELDGVNPFSEIEIYEIKGELLARKKVKSTWEFVEAKEKP